MAASVVGMMRGQRPRVLFVIETLQGGGAERVLTTIANELSGRGYSITVARHRSFTPAYELSPAVRSVCFEDPEARRPRVIRALLALMRCIRREDPDVVISFVRSMNLRAILACKVMRRRVIVSEHSTFTAGAWLRRLAMRVLYPLADHVTVLTRFERDEHFASFLRDNLSIVQNPVSVPEGPGPVAREKLILAAGSLERWKPKGFDKVLRIFAGLSPSRPEWRLAVLGTGAGGLAELRRYAATLGITDRVDFPGWVDEPASWYQRAEVFVLASEREALPMTLLEAIAGGCAAISFDCESGPGEIIESGHNGVLVEDQDEEALAEQLARLLDDASLRESLRRNCKSSLQRFTTDRVVEQWIDILDSVHAAGGEPAAGAGQLSAQGDPPHA